MLVFETGDSKQKFLLQIHQFDSDFHESAESFLSADELSYLSEINNDKRKHEYLQSRFALKTLLAKYLGLPSATIQFRKVGEGKPVLMNPTVHLDFNLSHSHDYFAIALSEKGQVGVDIEKSRAPKHLKDIAIRFFSEPEAQLIDAEQDPHRKMEIFAKFWSGKEALIKTVAGGVFKNVREVLIDEQSWKIKRLPLEFGSLSEWDLQFFNAVPGYTCSVAIKI